MVSKLDSVDNNSDKEVSQKTKYWFENSQAYLQETEKVKWETKAELKKHKNNIFYGIAKLFKNLWTEFSSSKFWKTILWLFWVNKDSNTKDINWITSSKGDTDVKDQTPKEDLISKSDDLPQLTLNSQGNEIPWDTPSDSIEVEPYDSDLVSVEKYIPSIKVDMRYAGKNNFTGRKVYENSEAKLRYWTIKKLKIIQEDLLKQWYSLKIWDAFRTQSAQDIFASLEKDRWLVATKSDHNRWCCLDVTLVKSDWTEIPMPSKFDDFKNKNLCKSDFSSVSWEKKKNWLILKNAMINWWFTGIRTEWRHYIDSNKTLYPHLG